MKTMTILIDGSENDRSSLATAATFCRAVDGRLRVVHPRPRDIIVASPEAAALVVDDRDIEARRAAARAAYDEVCGALSFAEWLETNDTVTEAIIGYGPLSDVTILERVSNDSGPEVLALNTALFDTPGPVLVTPPSSPSEIGRSIAAVWSPTVQSARAVRSALPIMATAASITVITNDADKGADPDALAGYLELHGVETGFRTFDGGGLTARGRGRAILAAAATVQADLLVMGAYGENRLSALIGLGRTTQKIVSATTIPTLVQR
jgi:nucleotide-binding universal stress UspA family protein